MIWVPGHRYHGGWVHGHYVRSEHRHHYNSRVDDHRSGARHDREDYRDSVERH